MRYPTDNLLTNFLIAVCCLFSLLIAIEWLLPYDLTSHDNPVPTVDTSQAPDTDSPNYVHPDFADFAEVLARPVFFMDRQMPPENVAAAPVARTPLRLKLEGVAIVADARIAVLRDQADNQLVQLSVGMSHNDWLLEEVQSTAATFSRDTDVVLLTLEAE
jgi:hypothetical protein